MACDTQLKQGQTITERKEEVRKVVDKLNANLVSGKVKPKVSPKGGITFEGLTDSDRDGVTDACAYRRIMATGSTLAKTAIARAETLAGRSVDKLAIGQGLHSHDGGKTWHDHKG